MPCRPVAPAHHTWETGLAGRAPRPPADGIVLRGATAGDAAALHDFVAASGTLDRNSRYAYLLLCTHFAETCLVARDPAGALLGFVAAYRLPVRPDTVFVWQIGVARSERGAGLGARLLDALLAQPACAGVRFVEATVTPSNHASQRLFRALARRRGAACTVQSWFQREHFGAGPHEAEDLYRIGPVAP